MSIPFQNYTQMPNVIFDHWLPLLSAAEFCVLSFMCRKIFGFHKRQDRMSLSQIAKGTGQGRSSVVGHIKSLIKHGIVQRFKGKTDHGDDDTNLFSIIMEGSPDPELGVVQNLNQGVVQNLDTQKKTYTKENNTKEILGAVAPVASADAERLKKLLLQKLEEINPKRKALSEKQTSDWLKDIDKMIRIDKREVKDIEAIITWFATDNFWAKTLQSADSLRRNFDKLIIQVNPPKTQETINREWSSKMLSDFPVLQKKLKINRKYICNIQGDKEIYFANHPPKVFEELFLILSGGKKK